MKTIIKGGTLVNENRIYQADIIIENDLIVDIIEGRLHEQTEDMQVIDAREHYVIPGIIDDQVHFREPGLTHKGDIAEGSRAAAAGGVTSFMDMPNVKPSTTTLQLLEEKQEIARQNAVINYSSYLGATLDNIAEIQKADPRHICGIKVFMGSSTGNMLVDQLPILEKIFAESPLLIATHCEDTPIIQHNLEQFIQKYGDQIPPSCHPLIRSREACLKSSSLAAQLAQKYQSRLHILHLSTAEELALLDRGERSSRRITGEVCVHHLWFNDSAYTTKGNWVKWNPAIKTETDRQALLQGINNDIISVIATDHAPHTITEKNGNYTQAASGGPMIQHSLIVLLELMEQGQTTLPVIIDKMCHAPADIFHIHKRGYLRKGYKADICIFKKDPWTVTKNNIRYKCGWSPLEGTSFSYRVQKTIVNGKIVYENNQINETVRGEMLIFD